MGLKDILFKKQKIIELQIIEYMDICLQCINTFDEAINCFVTTGCGESFDYFAEKIHKFESKADDVLKKLELDLYKKALIPESRGDIILLLEKVDKLPNIIETVLFEIRIQRMTIPVELIESFEKLASLSTEACRKVIECVSCLFNNQEKVVELVHKIDDLESEADHVQNSMLRELFELEIDLAEKLLFKSLITIMGNISDKAENIANRINLVLFKRRV